MSLSRLVNGASLVLDASSGLNLLGTGCAAEILRALPHEVVVTDKALYEIERDPLTGTPGSFVMEQLRAAGLLRVVNLSEPAYACYLSLVGAPSPDGLDDGEAATVAHAIDVGAAPVLDERKATRIAGSLCSSTPVCTLDLIAHSFVMKTIRRNGYCERDIFRSPARADARARNLSPLGHQPNRRREAESVQQYSKAVASTLRLGKWGGAYG